MDATLWGVVVAAVDPEAQARFWADALGWTFAVDAEGDAVVRAGDPDVPGLLFEPAGDPKDAVKNRVHLDLASTSVNEQCETVDRLVSHGATRVDIGQGDVPWVVLADPEGNELCVLDPRERYRDAPGLAAIVVDADDPELMAGFWAHATGWGVANRGEHSVSLHRPGNRPPDVDFVRVPEPKRVKNRAHLDVRPARAGEQDAVVSRLRALGATPADVGQGPEASWVVLEDPEGNEFCVLRGD